MNKLNRSTSNSSLEYLLMNTLSLIKEGTVFDIVKQSEEYKEWSFTSVSDSLSNLCRKGLVSSYKAGKRKIFTTSNNNTHY
ncbi:MAG: BlaI/MecI/CopY family transcriptional regulator [bacterium]|jgi:predicted transcriptional regulator